MNRARLIAAARGEEPADLVFTNARVVNVFSGEVEDADVALAEGHIAGVGDYAGVQAAQVVDLHRAFLAPAYIDPHIHLESTMLLPAEFARAVLPHGTTAVVSDPHEIANVLGLDGIRLLLALSEHLPLDFFFTLSSCVPATHLETSGASLSAGDLAQLIAHPRIVALAELMNFPGVLFRAPEVLAKLELAHAHGKPVDGHAPLLSGRDLNAYLCGGIGSDHECTHFAEAREKLARGMWVFIREGSTEKNLRELLPLVTPVSASRCCFATDDRHPEELLAEGHLNYTVHLAVQAGLDAVTALRLATLNPAQYFNLRWRGAIAPGYVADLQVLSGLDDGLLRPLAVYKQGQLVAESGEVAVDLPEPALEERFIHTVKLDKPLTAGDFAIPARSKRVRVIGVIPGQILTAARTATLTEKDGALLPDSAQDVLKLAVVERYTGAGGRSLAFVQGFGLKRGALASSVAHDSHNLIAVGADDADLACALNHLAERQGGFVAVKDGAVLAEVPLPVAGLMSLCGAREVSLAVRRLNAAVRDELGCALASPFMALSFLALPVIPALKLTDQGLVEVGKFDFVALEADGG